MIAILDASIPVDTSEITHSLIMYEEQICYIALVAILFSLLKKDLRLTVYQKSIRAQHPYEDSIHRIV